jgi:hypothetical protein
MIRSYDVATQMALCHMRCHSEQRVVHQHPCAPDESGHCVAPEGVFFRSHNIGSCAKMNATIFRRLIKTGWLRPRLQTITDQVEYDLRPEAHERFDRDPQWQWAESSFRQVFKLPPALRAVG